MEEKYSIIKEELNNISNSFLGCDGGNFHSDIWVCGLEFGAEIDTMEDYYKNSVNYYAENGFMIPYRKQCPVFFENSPYDLYLSLFVKTLFNADLSVKEYLKHRLYNRDSDIFKLNLYPLAKKDSSWDKSIETKLEIVKSEYYAELKMKRFGFFDKVIKQNPGKTIICTAIKGTVLDYLDAFMPASQYSQVIEKRDYRVNVGKDSKSVTVFKTKNIKLVVIPFFGRGNGNLNSHESVRLMAEFLKSERIIEVAV
jgi:hypothetical protein